MTNTGRPQSHSSIDAEDVLRAAEQCISTSIRLLTYHSHIPANDDEGVTRSAVVPFPPHAACSSSEATATL
jgi:hypothetical protein